MVDLTPNAKPTSHVSGVGYDEEARELVVSYRGRLVRYADVPKQMAELVIESPDMGAAVQSLIRNKYEFRYSVD
jgi:KTSC domain